VGSIPSPSTSKEKSNFVGSPRFARRPNCREFWAKKSISGFVLNLIQSKRKFFQKELLTNQEKNMKYIIYARKSTEEDDRQVLSIEAQLVELKEFAAKEKLEIVASLCEAKTAKEPDKNIGSNHIL